MGYIYLWENRRKVVLNTCNQIFISSKKIFLYSILSLLYILYIMCSNFVLITNFSCFLNSKQHPALHFLRWHPDAILHSALRSNRDEVILINDLLAVVLEREGGIDGGWGWGLENAEGYRDSKYGCRGGKVNYLLCRIIKQYHFSI